jgi:superfamily II DNA/RNA helicase
MHTCLTIIEQVLQRNEQVIVFSPFHAPLDGLEQLLREAGVRALKLDGRTSQKRRADLAALFKAGSGPDGWPVLLAGQECMAEGHSFHLCNNVIQYSYPWALDKVIQAEDRAHRLNSVKPLNAYRLICNGSIDRKMESQIDEKSDAAEMVLDGHLLGEQKQEMNMAELLEVAAREIALVGDTVHEMTLAAQWPELRARLKAAGKGEDGRRKTEDSKLQRPESPLATRHSPPAPAPFNWRTAFVRRPVLVAAGC